MSALKKVLKLSLIVLLLLCITFLSGCKGFSITADDFLSPPRANGEMYKVEQTLKESVDTAYTLKYPTSGEYRSAYVLADLTESGVENFALAFYSTTNDENTTFMHLKLMQKVDNKWLSISDVTVNAIGIEKLEIDDLNADGVKEITIGWNVYGGMDKKVTVYTLEGLKLEPIMQENYTNFMCCDLLGNSTKEVFIIYHNMVDLTATASYYTIENDIATKAGSCAIDGTVISYSEPVYSALQTGAPAIYVDAAKGTGMQTEIIYCSNGELVAPLYQSASMADYVYPTYRNSTVASFDINADGCVDIPLLRPFENLNLTLDENTLNPITNWCSYNGSGFTIILQAVMNYTDGYYIDYPKNWVGCTTVAMEIQNRLRTIYLWDVEEGNIKSELVRIRAISEVNWDKPHNGFNDYKEIIRHEGIVYAAMISNYDGPEKITMETLKKIFYVIE